MIRRCAGSAHAHSGPVRADSSSYFHRLPPRELTVLSGDGLAVRDSPCFRSFGIGSGLSGTKNHFIRIGLIDARAVWYIAIGAIVTGHIVAVYLAHCIALKANSDRQAALRSQWPMVPLMVCYTMTSLWIIAQPIVVTP